MVRAEGAAVEEDPFGQPHGLVEVFLLGLFSEGRRIDADVPEYAVSHRTVGVRAFNRIRAAMQESHRAVDRYLVAFGVPAKVIVVVEDEDACVRTLLAIDQCG